MPGNLILATQKKDLTYLYITMKKILLLVAAASVLLLHPSFTSGQTFREGDNIVSAGLGFGSSYGGLGAGSESPAIIVHYEHGNWSVGGPGVISIGGFLGYKSYSYDYLQYYSQSVSYTVLGVRSAYHYSGLDNKDWDVYGGAMISYNIASYSYTSYDARYDNYNYDDADSQFRFSLFLGGRYYVTEKVALFAELGYGIANFTLGASFRL